ncbi:MAG: ankyrin repeat domain-containing protein [Acetobacteraceae bacterium]|nr:ankyrin repeat domain-containing protein [Acetobacteraceae bacterium]
MAIRSRLSALLGPAVAGLFLIPLAAHAQFQTNTGLGNFTKQGGQAKPATGGKQEPPPPALPGAASRAGSAAPPTQVPTDMAPNDALFDAINRGDIGAARDAISRGADLNAHNVLSMTPMEVAVDLGRNDIAFLLLSERGATPRTRSAPPPDAATVASAAPPKQGGAARRAEERKRATAVKADAAARPTPRLFANDGGTPVPSAGFLGFDSGRAR